MVAYFIQSVIFSFSNDVKYVGSYCMYLAENVIDFIGKNVKKLDVMA